VLQWMAKGLQIGCSHSWVEEVIPLAEKGTVSKPGSNDASDAGVYVDRETIEALLSREKDVVAAYLFGSVARGCTHPTSDVDLAVLLDPELSAVEQVERQLALMGALDTTADRPVQITLLNRASLTLIYQVLRDGVLLRERDSHERIAFEVRAIRLYLDLKPMLESLSEKLMSRIREEGLGRRDGRPSRALEAAQRIRERLERSTGR
jgi:predicted nucleotidyltransferase